MHLSEPRQRDQARRQFGQHPLARNRLEARMQRGELHRNARSRRRRRVAGARRDRLDRARIGGEIFFRGGGGAGTLAEHIEGIAEFGVAAAARQRFRNGLAEHEMRADEPHRLSRRRAQRRQAEPLDDRIEDRLRRLARMDHPGGDAERPGRGRNEQRRRFDVAVKPAAGGELVLDQPVGGGGVGHAQQRLGEHHQGQAFLGGKRVGVEKVLDAAEAAEAAGPGADRLDQRPRAYVDAPLGGGIAAGIGEERRRQRLVGRRERSAERARLLLRLRHRRHQVGGGHNRGHERINDPDLFAPHIGKFRLRFAMPCSLSECGRT